MKKLARKFMAKMQEMRGSSVITGVTEICIGVVGLIVVEAFVAPTILTGTDSASNLAQTALPLGLVLLIFVGMFTAIKSATSKSN
jgi:hypothetical protein